MLYNNSAFQAPYNPPARLNTQTPPVYLFGSFDPSATPWRFAVTSVALTGNVATIGVTLRSGGNAAPGAAPQVGAKMGVRATQTNGGAFNVDPATVTAVSWNAATGTGTISFALTHANVSTTADTGELVVQPYEAPDLVAQGSASRSFALWFGPDESDNSRSMFCEVKWSGTMPTSATVVLEVANVDDDSRYAAVENAQGVSPSGVVAASDALATVAGSAVTQSGALYQFIMAKFIRSKVLAMTGGDGTTGLILTCFS